MNRVVLITVGVTPAVVTETLFALDKRDREENKKPRMILRMLTTSEGCEVLQKELLDGGILEQLQKERDLNLADVGESSIIVFGDRPGNVEDIQSDEDVLAMGNLVCREVAHWRRAPDCSIHASIAGGRKPMSLLLGFAVTMLGDEGDELSHVMTVPGRPDEDCASPFFYPTASNPGSENVTVNLVDVPIPLLGGRYFEALGHGDTSYTDVVSFTQQQFSPSITFDLPRGCVKIGGENIPMPASVIAGFAWVYLRIKLGKQLAMPPTEEDLRAAEIRVNREGRDWSTIVESYQEWFDAGRELFAIYQQAPRSRTRWDRLHPFNAEALEDMPCLTMRTLSEARSNARTATRNALGAHGFAESYAITEEMMRGNVAPLVCPERVTFIWDDDEVGHQLLADAE